MAAPQTAPGAEFQDGGKPVAHPIYQVDVNGNPVNQPTLNAAVAAGAGTANQIIKGNSGYLSGVVVTATGTANLLIYDNASTNAGTVIGVIPSSAALGQFFPFNMPALQGITAAKASGTPAVTVAFS